MTHALNGIAPLTHLGVIRAAGEDAVKFLQGQLTQDFALLKPDEARLAAFCSAKGRMQASFIGFTLSADEVLLICSRDILAPTLKRLSMFVMRAKAKLSDVTADFALYGLAGEPAGALFADTAPAWSRTVAGEAQAVKLYPADGQPRALWVAPASAAAPAGPALSQDLWQWGEVQSGVATLTAPIVEAFVPQMLNYESVGGVNFKKGCYPGQEIVARSQFRGTLKRRAYLVHLEGEAAAGQEVFEAGDASQPAGIVAQAAPAPSGGFDAIVSLQTAAAQAGQLKLGAADGPALQIQPLPYALLEDI
ncbi:MAG: folate-binding protein [Pseudomonadota bacterium]